MRTLNQSTARNVMVFMTDEDDHLTGLTGLTLTCTLSKDGAEFASISPTVTERGNGWYNIALTSTHTNTVGDLVLRATATGADSAEVAMQVVDPLTAAEVNAECDTALADVGLTTTITGRIDAAISTRATAADLDVTVEPYSAHAPQRVSGTKLTAFLKESTDVSLTVNCYDADGDPLSLTGLTLKYHVAPYDDPDAPIYSSDSFTGSGTSFTLALNALATAAEAIAGQAHHWSLRQGTKVLQRGRLEVVKTAAPAA